MTLLAATVHPDWLALREPADAVARSSELVERLRPHLPSDGLVVHDLGGGTGSTGRWLAPRLDGPQTWVVHDRDPVLLGLARSRPPAPADGAPVVVETRPGDVTRLGPGALAGAGLVTSSALLDLLTAAELDRVVRSCAAACCPVLLTLTVAGRVDLAPSHALDLEVQDAFNAHQQRSEAGRALLGPAAVQAAATALSAAGFDVASRPSPWRLGSGDAALAAAWLAGWVGAAVEQRPALAAAAGPYLGDRLEQAHSGELRVVVRHVDLLALPR